VGFGSSVLTCGSNVKVGIAAAGSGGHVFPALAVADALVAKGLSKEDVVFFGGDRMESHTVPETGYPFVQLDVRGIRRSLSMDNLTLPLKVRAAARVVADRIESEKINVMVVFGGYVSGPAGVAARRKGVPLVIHEANAVPGVANRLLAPIARTVYVAFEPAASKFRNPTVVGNPLRPEFESFDRAELMPAARSHYGIEQDAVVLGVVGGSLGASALNEIAEAVAADRDRSFHILHITGEPHYGEIATRAESHKGWTVLPFEVEMVRFYAASDVVISRAGAMTVSELHATATPSILVPLPSGKGYQGRNADDLVNAGGGVVIPQDRKDEIIATAIDLLNDDVKRKAMTETATASRPSGVADTIADHIMGVVDDG
jgi:UDP-N-acetylglucosamine--N-acetylmuramyl-(pentapeptide) pyrophosphoryl-undecaprenol N-acetylglucosamine transferase